MQCQAQLRASSFFSPKANNLLHCPGVPRGFGLRVFPRPTPIAGGIGYGIPVSLERRISEIGIDPLPLLVYYQPQRPGFFRRLWPVPMSTGCGALG
jgi:hypothetical protein